MSKQSDLSNSVIFPIGGPMPEAFSSNFTGQAYLHMLTTGKDEWNCPIGNVTFEPGCRNNWHKHPGGQILLVTGGCGWYQEWEQPARKLRAGDIVTIPADVKHWHGAAKDSWFVHLSIETNADRGAAEWLEPVDAAAYEALE